MWAKIITIKRSKDLNYFSLGAFNLFYTRVSQFELNYWNKLTFPQHSNLLRCIYFLNEQITNYELVRLVIFTYVFQFSSNIKSHISSELNRIIFTDTDWIITLKTQLFRGKIVDCGGYNFTNGSVKVMPLFILNIDWSMSETSIKKCANAMQTLVQINTIMSGSLSSKAVWFCFGQNIPCTFMQSSMDKSREICKTEQNQHKCSRYH